ncbi:unnamed protein product [Choristocarpus tenellus]
MVLRLFQVVGVLVLPLCSQSLKLSPNLFNKPLVVSRPVDSPRSFGAGPANVRRGKDRLLIRTGMTASGPNGNEDFSSIGSSEPPAWGWSKEEPKSSLRHLQSPLPKSQAWSANPLVLNLVQLFHWALSVPAILISLSVLRKMDFWLGDGIFGGSKERLLLLLLSPVIGFVGGLLPAIMMHEYEGWQVAPFKNPLLEKFDIRDNNNQLVREVAYRLVLLMQFIGLQTFSLAVLGFGFFNGTLLTLSIAGMLSAYLGNQKWKATFYLFDQSTFPVAWLTLIPFSAAMMLNLYAFHAIGNSAVGMLALLPTLLIFFGGVLESLLVETRFNQWCHVGAVAIMNAGIWLQWAIVRKIPLV